MREDPFGRDGGATPTTRPRRGTQTEQVREPSAAGQVTPPTRSQPASLGKRVGAYIIDQLAVGIVLTVIGVRAGIIPAAAETMSRDQAYAAGAIASLAVLLYFVVLEAAFGQTLAKRLLGIRVLMADGRRVTVRAAFTRRILFVAGMLVPVVGGLVSFAVPLAALITAIQDEPTTRGFHDHWAATSVVEASRSRRQPPGPVGPVGSDTARSPKSASR